MPTNNQRAERQYTKEYMRTLKAIFNATNAWGKSLQPVQVLDGVKENAKAFSVKTNNTPVVIGTYNTGANIAFGTGTANSSRFGNMTEVKYTDTDVPYDYDLCINEGLDPFTVNMELDVAVSERLEVQSLAQTRHMNGRIGAYLGAKAGNFLNYETLNEANVIAAFTAFRAFFVNKEVIVPVTAHIAPEVYSILLTAGLITTAKNSKANIDEGTIEKSFGFVIDETPSQYFAEGEVAYFVPEGIVLPFVGISETRTIPRENALGLALQSAAKGGTYASDENLSVVSKITIGS